MSNNQIYIELANIKKSLELMQNERNNLENLISKVKSSYESFKNYKLSGKAYDQCLLNYEYFLNEMSNRLLELQSMITNLKMIYNRYTNFYETSNIMVGDNNV